MERTGSRWRVTEVGGVGDYLLSLEEVEQLRLDQVNAPIRKEISAHVELARPIRVHTRTVPNGWFSVREEIVARARIRNVGKDTVHYALFTVAAGGQQLRIGTFPFRHIAPGEETMVEKSIPHQLRPVYQALLRGDASGYAIVPQNVGIRERGMIRDVTAHASWQDHLDLLKDKQSGQKQRSQLAGS
jgi:hypothetical protein